MRRLRAIVGHQHLVQTYGRSMLAQAVASEVVDRSHFTERVGERRIWRLIERSASNDTEALKYLHEIMKSITRP